MTLDRSPLLPFVLLGITALAANACGGGKSGDDDSSSSGKGAVLSGGTTSAGGTGQGGGGATTEAGGTANGGKTTTTGGSSGSAGSLAGSSGTSGTSGKGGGGAGGTTSSSGGTTSGTGGSSGTSSTSTSLGKGCTQDADCGSGLICIAQDDTQTLGGASPPGGLCTAACTADADCNKLETGAYCLPTSSTGSAGYCIEACTFGSASSPKCQSRSNFACTPIGESVTSKSCTSSSDCSSTQICDSMYMMCADLVTGCWASCRGDFDCSSGEYCDFASGMCIQGTATGLPLGSACDPNAKTDPCNGTCVPVDNAGTIGTCTSFCPLNSDFTGCGWDGKSTATAGCLFTPGFENPSDLGENDIGLCGALCDCNTDCTVQTEYCVDDTNGVVMKLFGRAGYCRPLQTGETSADTIACK